MGDTPPAESRVAGLSWKKKVFFLAVIYFMLVFLFEVGARLLFFATDNFNPYYLTFGLVPDIEQHSAEHDGYTKFQPNTIYHYKSSPTKTIDMKINGDGFRGLDEFTKPKPPETFRIVSMGASSTFGLTDEDDETYPYLLQKRIREQSQIPHGEAFNLGVPHYRMDNIVALADHELAALEPDVVTLYSGYNNSMVVQAPTNVGGLYNFKNWLKAHSVAYRGLHPRIATIYGRLSGIFNRNLGGTPTLNLPIQLEREDIARLRQSMREEYRGYVVHLADLANEIGATLVLVTQSYTLRQLPSSRLAGDWQPYADEVAHVEGLLEEDGTLLAPYSTLLIHRDLMDELRAVAAERGLPLVEGITVLDPDRDQMMSRIEQSSL